MEENKNIQNEQATENNETPATETAANGGFFANKKNVYIVAAIAAVAIVAGIVLAIVFGGKNNNETPDNGDGAGQVDGGNGDSGDNGNGNGEGDNGGEEGIAANTTGAALYDAFAAALEANNAATAVELAETLAYNSNLPFAPMAMPIEVGSEYFTGFDNYVITGYSSAAVFMPMIGSIPFVGYIFQVEEGIDMINYVNDLSANCNPRWNVCVEADETLVGYYGNTVFFLMCPASMGE